MDSVFKVNGVNNKLFPILGICLTVVLAGCSTTNKPTPFVPQTTVRVVTHTVYPTLSEINVPKSPSLKQVTWDYPRDTTTEEVIRNTTVCRAVPVAEQTVEFWAECGQFPIDPTSNLFIGLNQENYNNLNFNLETMRQHIILLNERLTLSNQQRTEFNQKANE